MYSSRVRLILLLAAFAFAGNSFANGRITWILAVVAAVAIAVGYFRSGTVWLAFQAWKSGHNERVCLLLDQNRFPDWLSSQSRAYFEFLRGLLASADERWLDAQAHFKAALTHRLRTDNDRSLVECYLATTMLNLGDPVGARSKLTSAMSRAHKPEVDTLVNIVETALTKND